MYTYYYIRYINKKKSIGSSELIQANFDRSQWLINTTKIWIDDEVKKKNMSLNDIMT